MRTTEFAVILREMFACADPRQFLAYVRSLSLNEADEQLLAGNIKHLVLSGQSIEHWIDQAAASVLDVVIGRIISSREDAKVHGELISTLERTEGIENRNVLKPPSRGRQILDDVLTMQGTDTAIMIASETKLRELVGYRITQALSELIPISQDKRWGVLCPDCRRIGTLSFVTQESEILYLIYNHAPSETGEASTIRHGCEATMPYLTLVQRPLLRQRRLA